MNRLDFEIIPTRDSYNSSPIGIEFSVFPEEKIITMKLDDRIIEFSGEEMFRLVRLQNC